MSSPYVNNIDNVQFYRVSFSRVPSLIKKRTVFIMQGEAFVPEREMAFVFVSHFKRILISSFEVGIKMIIISLPTTVIVFYFTLHSRLHAKLEPICTMMKDLLAFLPIWKKVFMQRVPYWYKNKRYNNTFCLTS